MEKIAQLEKQIIALEYRLRLLERYIDKSGELFLKNDESSMNTIRMEVMQGMQKDGIAVDDFKKSWGIGFYRHD